VYSACVHARIPNRQPHEDPRKSRVSDKSARILVRVRLVDDPCTEVGKDIRVSVGVRVCIMECNHYKGCCVKKPLRRCP